MDLDSRQTRGLFLAGTVAFPRPFPSTGIISLDVGHLAYSPGEQPHNKDLVISQEHYGNKTVLRVMLQQEVSAVFIQGIWRDKGAFRISHRSRVDSFERGVWFLDSDVNPATVRARLHLQPQDDISTRNSILRGIVFIAGDRRILNITEVAQTAAEEAETTESPCTCCFEPHCPCTCCR